MVLNWPFSRYSIGSSVRSDAVDVAFAEQSLGPHQQESQYQHVGEPLLDAPALELDPAGQGLAKEYFREFFANADDQPAEDGSRDRGHSAQDCDRQRLERHLRERKLDAELGAPHQARDQGHEARHRPHDYPDPIQWNSDRLRS